MKSNKLKYFVLAALAATMACGPIALAQDNPPPPTPATPPPPPGDNGAPPPRPGRNGNGAMQAALEKLDLTPDQKEKVGAALKTQRDKVTALRADSSVVGADRRAKLKEIREEFNNTLKGILTADQFAKWTDMQKNMRPPGGAPPPAPAPPKTDN